MNKFVFFSCAPPSPGPYNHMPCTYEAPNATERTVGGGQGWARGVGARRLGSSFSASRREEQPLGHVGQELEERAGEVARRSVEGE